MKEKLKNEPKIDLDSILAEIKGQSTMWSLINMPQHLEKILDIIKSGDH